MALEITEWTPTGAGRVAEPNPWIETVEELSKVPRDGKTAGAVTLKVPRYEYAEDGLVVKDAKGKPKDSSEIRKFNNQVNAAARTLNFTVLRAFHELNANEVRVVMRPVDRQAGKGRKGVTA